MRNRFKFRTFDKADGLHRDEDEVNYFNNHLPAGDYTAIMQCTGLKDINGNLIYEGDIIKKDSALFVVDIMPYMCLSPVIKNTGETHYYESGNNNFTGAEDYRYQDNIEIMGNIYENPELIRN